jgi:hypothetical protein
MRGIKRLVLNAAVLALAAAPSAGGAVECVRPSGGGGCHATIQEAVDASSPGELIAIFPGTYAGGVNIPGTKAGVQLVGMGATPGSVLLTGAPYGFDVDAAGVTIKNLKIVGVNQGIFVSMPRGRIVNVVVLGASGYGIGILGADAVVRNCLVSATGQDGITSQFGSPYGENLQVLSTTVRQTGGAGLNLGGDGTAVIGSRVENVRQDAMYIDGLRALVRGSAVLGAGAAGIRIANSYGRVLGNQVEGVGSAVVAGVGAAASPAVDVSGADAILRDNVVRDPSRIGYLYFCGPCAAAAVTNNVAVNAFGDMPFRITAAAPGLLVGGNLARGCRGGMIFGGVGALIAGNSVLESGRDTPAFVINGTDDAVTDNLAVENGREGFAVTGAAMTLSRNRAVLNAGPGFLLNGTGTVFIANEARRNARGGILLEAGSSGATLRRNVALGNFPDFCDSGSGTVLGSGPQANIFGTSCF